MADLISGVKATMKAGKALIAAEKWVRGGALQKQFDEANRRLSENINQVVYAICKGLVARALGRAPNDEEVDEYMAGAIDDPTFPARAHLLLGAMRKSSSNERLQMLAGILFGKSFLQTPSADLERVDILAERLLPEDVQLLQAINSTWQRLPNVQAGQSCLAVEWHGLRVLHFPSDPVTLESLGHLPIVSRAALDALLNAGCIAMPDGFTSKGPPVEGIAVPHGPIEMSALGTMFIEALDTVRAEAEAHTQTRGR